MAKDPAFLFYPGDYLQDTQGMSERSQVAYDRIICKHMLNIPITKEQLNHFTKRLDELEKSEVMSVLTKFEGGYIIEWVAESINKRKAFSRSRAENRIGKKKKDILNTSLTYVSHMENVIVNENENVFKGGVGENFIKPSEDEKNHELPKHEIENCKVIVSSRTNPRHYATDDEIISNWNEFKAHKFNGQNTYYGWNKVYEAFKNWLGYQISNNKFFTNVTNSKNGGTVKRTGTEIILDKMRAAALKEFSEGGTGNTQG